MLHLLKDLWGKSHITWFLSGQTKLMMKSAKYKKSQLSTYGHQKKQKLLIIC